MTDNGKIHTILGILTSKTKDSFLTSELSKLSDNKLTLAECNYLCQTLIDNGDLIEIHLGPHLQGQKQVLKTNKTQYAYDSNKYPNLDKELESTIVQTTVMGDNYAPIINANQSSFSDFGQSFSTNMPDTAPTKTKNQSLLEKSLKYIGDHIVKIIVTIIAAYIVYRLGWRK